MYPCSDLDVDPAVLSRVGHALFTRIRDVYAAAGISLPTRQVWIAGEGVYDCEQLIVAVMSLREGLIDSNVEPSQRCDVPVIASFKVTVVRCIPVPDSRGNPPTPEQLSVATDQLVTDGYLLMKSACKFDMWGAGIVPEVHPSALGGMGTTANVEFEEASGGMQAVSLTLDTVIG